MCKWGTVAICQWRRAKNVPEWLSIVLADVGVGFVEKILVAVEFVFEEGFSQFLLHEAFALGGVLPIGEADLLHDVVYVGDDALDNDVGVVALGFFEQLGQGLLRPVALLGGIGFLLGLYDILDQFEDFFQELEAGEEDLFMALFDFLQVLAEAGDEQHLYFPALLHRIGIFEDVVEDLGVHDQGLHVIADGLDMNVLIDEVNGLGAQRVPEQFAVAAGRFD